MLSQAVISAAAPIKKMDRPRPSPPIQITTHSTTQNLLLGRGRPPSKTNFGRVVWPGLFWLRLAWFGVWSGLVWSSSSSSWSSSSRRRRCRRRRPSAAAVAMAVGSEGGMGADIAAWGYWDTPVHGEASPWMEVPQSIMRPQNTHATSMVLPFYSSLRF
jgi:hypothetical protein